MIEITACGTPYEIGYTHGSEAKPQIASCIDFYSGLFVSTAKLEWPAVRELAQSRFEPNIRKEWPDYHEEMSGIADGAEVELADIIAINVRTEISFGLFSDGCTALSWLASSSPSRSFLAQNWDWMAGQKPNLILLTIHQQGPDRAETIRMVTEAGLIGKIGLNSSGVGVLLNAIKAKGMNPTRLPCHLGLRMVLDSRSREEAVQRLERYGIASSCHMLVADTNGGVGLEWSHLGVEKVHMNANGQVFHTNHYLVDHKGVEDTNWLPDSNFRRSRIEELCKRLPEPSSPTEDQVFNLFTDEANLPGSICRAAATSDSTQTLFNIVMDLKAKTALITQGRPVTPEWQTRAVF
ncbi:AAT-domain-containing protein [Polychaeton citri CBS 116435]|uniref:AAT-domain-containing protein n=1 Tax=Polychaeton citri CBS 116435 TaxID=1314669 RepID=A0A9P4QCN7_9PEZI|nr:AAT-domain-containing protein [Polychaeton citri CBS 116435]